MRLRMVSSIRRVGAIVAVGLVTVGIGARPLHAQGWSGIVGKVTDPSSAVVISAKVTSTEVGTGFTRTVSTDSNGYFVLTSLRPTLYALSIEAAGFRKFEQTGITLSADQTLTIDVKLEVGPQTQTVTVQSSAPQVDTYTPTLLQVVDQRRMIELPLNGRNAASLTTLVAGVVVDTGPGNDADQGSTKTFPTAVTVSTNGSRQNQVAFLLDGANNVDNYTNVNMPFPFPDALQEFSEQTSNYSAEYGQNAGGVVNVVTRSGTNSLHGDLFEFDRNAVLNARNFFALSRPPYKRNQFGGTAGGPVVLPGYNGKDHTFFFFGYQATEIRNTLNAAQAFVPTPANLTGDFSSLLSTANPANPVGKIVQLMDPATGAPFPNNQIPTTRFDPAAIGLAKKYLPTGIGNGRFYYPQPQSQDFHEFLTRIDQSIGSKDRLSFRYFGDQFHNAAFFVDSDLLTNSTSSTILSQNYLLHETHTFRPNLLNDLQFGYTRVHSQRGPVAGVPNFADLGVNIYEPSTLLGINSLVVSGFFSISNSPPAFFVRNDFNWSDDVKWIRGGNSFAFGGVVDRSRMDISNLNNVGGTFNFSGDTTGNALADFLLGSNRTFAQNNGQYVNDRNSFYGLYINDTYRATRRLTLSAGLRWEPWFPWNEIRGRVEQFQPGAYAAGTHSRVYPNAPPGLFFQGDSGFPSAGTNHSLDQFAPRLGFAYNLTGDGKTSIRGGAGTFYDTRTYSNTNIYFSSLSPFSVQQSLTNPRGPFSNPLLGLSSPFPTRFPPPSNIVFPSPVVAATFDPSGIFKVPVSYNWNLTIERQLLPDWLVRIAYVGMHANHIAQTVQLNPAVYQPGSTLSVDQRRLFPGYSNIYADGQVINSNYNGLQITLDKRFTQNLTILANYTYSKSLDDQAFSGGVGGIPSGSYVSPVPWYRPGLHQMDYGPAEFDRRQNFVVSYVWALPRLEKSGRLTRAVLGDWMWSGILSASTGDPLTVLAGLDRAQTGLGSDRAVDLGGNHYAFGPCANSAPCVTWLNPSAFALPPIGSYGNIGKNSLRGLGLFNWDMGLFKSFSFTERWRLQFRTEFFNLFNRTNFNDPSYTVNSGGFGRIGSAKDPRIGQLALKLYF